MTSRRNTPALRRRARSLVFGAVALIMSAGASSAAADAPPAPASAPTLAARITETTLTPAADAPVPLGAPITLSVTVEHPQDSRVIAPETMPNTRWEVVKQDRALAPGSGEATQRTTLLWTFLMGRPGKTTLPPLDIDVRGSGGQRVTLKTTPVTAHITSVLPAFKPGADAPELAPAQPPEVITRRDYTPLYLAIAALVAALLAGVAFALWRRRPHAALPDAPPQPSHVVAREALLAIREEGIIERGELVEATVRMSEIVRTYLGKRFRLPGAELTTTELMQRLAASPTRILSSSSVSLEEIRAWLDETDYIKFSRRAEPDAEGTTASLDQALELVERLRPRQDMLEAVADADDAEQAAAQIEAPDPEAPDADDAAPEDATTHDPDVLPAHPALLAAARAAMADDEAPPQGSLAEAHEASDNASDDASDDGVAAQAADPQEDLADIPPKTTEDLADTTPAVEAS